MQRVWLGVVGTRDPPTLKWPASTVRFEMYPDMILEKHMGVCRHTVRLKMSANTILEKHMGVCRHTVRDKKIKANMILAKHMEEC
eukprot:scaffold31873_cov21-Tisochrysis_lutea.AAC.1